MAQPTHSSNRLMMGIDLGTTNSCVGVLMNGRVEIVPGDQGTRTTPSCVAFTDSERLVGEGANHQIATNASNTVFDVKRLMGRSSSEPSVKSNARHWPFGVMESPDHKPRIKVSYLGKEKEFSPEEISAMLLVKLKETAEAYVGEKITNAVITVPAYFNSPQRQATKDAAAIAGLSVMRIINEPTAAAVAYSHNRGWKDSTVLVYDLGGGTLDVSLVVIHNGCLKVIATAGDTHLGGEDFTNKMVDHFVDEFKKKNHHISGDISCDTKALGRLRRSCEDAKRKLSTNPRTTVEVDALFEGVDFQSTITRDKFLELNEELFGRCMEPIAKCLNDAKMDKTKLDDVVLVGGCTRIPRVQQLVRDFFNGKELCRNINADEAVAYGATIQAAILMGGSAHQVVDITPFSQGIGMLEGLMLEVIQRNTTIPTNMETTFVAVKDNQCCVEITVYEDGRAMANKFLVALDPKTKVGFEIDHDGILHVYVPAQDKKSWICITNLVGSFSEVEIERMSQEAQEYKAQDEKHNKNVQARNDIQDLLFTIGNNMKNLEDSAARFFYHQEATREQEKRAPVVPDSASCRPLNVSVPGLKNNKAHDKEKKKMLQAHNDAIKKLQDRIKKLKETAYETTLALENEEHDTFLIITLKKEIEDEYHNIIKLIESASQSKFNKPIPNK